MDNEFCPKSAEDEEKNAPVSDSEFPAEVQEPAELPEQAQPEAVTESTEDPEAQEQAPVCAEPEEEATAEDAVPEEEAAAENAEPTEEEPEAQPEKKKKNTTPILIGVIAALAIVIVVLIVMIVSSMKKPAETAEPAPAAASEQVAAPEEAPAEEAQSETAQSEAVQEPELTGNGISYTIAAEDITPEKTAAIVATCGDDKLTAGMLNLYYWQQYYSFANTYGMYLSYLLDASQPLELQMYDADKNWQQMFLDGATDMFTHISAIRQEAEKNGYQLSAEDQQTLDTMPADLEAAALSYGYENADAYLQDAFGPMVTLDDYMEFVRANLIAGGYLDQLVAAETFTDEDISAYFDEHADEYAQSGITKTDKPNVDVRHILIMPEEMDDDGNYTEAAWETARKTAQEIYDKWLAGDKTEESFAELAKENSADGSAQDGGLITDIYPGQMVEEFNDWCFADGRKPGDHGLVKTMYGYHVMYFSGTGEEIYWKTVVKEDCTSDRAIGIEDGITAKYPSEINLDNAAIFDVLAAQAAAAGAE